jgi:hypothetical protein
MAAMGIAPGMSEMSSIPPPTPITAVRAEVKKEANTRKSASINEPSIGAVMRTAVGA